MTKPPNSPPLLAFGAHPDDLEFGAGGIIARETRAGRAVHLVVCSRGEAGTNGTPAVRTREAKAAAKILGATLEFLELDGDAHLGLKTAHAFALAAIIRRVRPGVVLAPTTEPNQHPDHWRLG
ncbi:MAG TPA: PIG-L family deacetylase, partial [Lacunisphaera sp.]|nr:PIG-L family deacetylase [Lacunisphaera sp.]